MRESNQLSVLLLGEEGARSRLLDNGSTVINFGASSTSKGGQGYLNADPGHLVSIFSCLIS